MKLRFIVIGAHKAGTTSLFAALQSHPEVRRAAVKEPHYFLPDDVARVLPSTVREAHEYEAIWSGGLGQHRGESSVLYLPFAKPVVARMIPYVDHDTRFIALLRHPLERAHSAFLDARRHEWRESETHFTAALAAEEERRRDPTSTPTTWYRRLSHYADDLEVYRQAFGPAALHVAFFEDLVRDAETELGRICHHIGLTPPYPTKLPHHNSGGTRWRSEAVGRAAKHPATATLRRRLRSIAPASYTRVKGLASERLMRPADKVTPETRTMFLAGFEEETARVESITGNDLASWRR